MSDPDQNRKPVVTSFWTGGCNSAIHQVDIPKSQYGWGYNIVNRGGIIQTRFGRKLLANLPGGRAQGGVIFKPVNSLEQVFIAIDGIFYVGYFPNFEFVPLTTYTRDASVEFIEMEVCYQSSKYNDDGTISLVRPRTVVIIQDGLNRALSWDGETLKELNPAAPSYGTPIGTWMQWSGSRLWMIVGNQVVASDQTNPEAFSEDQFLAEKSRISLPGDGTGIIEAADKTGILAFTRSTTTGIKSFIRTRSEWALTQEFSKVIFPEIGCLAGRSPCNRNGETFWLSNLGFISFDAALNSQQTSVANPIDSEMMRSKCRMSADPRTACSESFENFIVLGVPAGSKYNNHTWVMDGAPMGAAMRQGAWSGVNVGNRPTIFLKGKIGGKDRLYSLCYDEDDIDGKRINLWEEFRHTREDDRGRIKCQWETGIIASEHLMAFKYAELELVEIYGVVELEVFVSGTLGPWESIGTIKLQAEVGCIGSSLQPFLTNDSIMQNFKKQSRTVSTNEFTTEGTKETPEIKLSEVIAGKDKGFQLLFEWTGQMGIREIKMFIDPMAAVGERGKCPDDETNLVNAINEAAQEVESE